MQEEMNAIRGFHIRTRKDGKEYLYPKKYSWYIPKTLRTKLGDEPIKPGDVVFVDKTKPVLVVEVFHHEGEKRLAFVHGVVSRYEKQD